MKPMLAACLLFTLTAVPAVASGASGGAAQEPAAKTPEVIALFNGSDLSGWHADVPAADADPDLPAAFVVKDGLLISQSTPQGHLITDESFQDYRLEVEYRWPGEPGNCGILVHASTPRRLYGMFPQSIECQLHAGNAGDFWCIGEDITVPDMEARRGPRERWGTDGDRARRIRNLTDDSERPAGEWNEMVIECKGSAITVWVNGDLVNHGTGCTARRGQIAVQAEGAACEFRKIQLTPLSVAEAESAIVLQSALVRMWEHESSDLPVDPRIRFGYLKNGLRFAFAENGDPRDRCYLRLHVNAGSLAESDDERGLAHFLEHMAFNGSKHYPAGTLIEWFQSHGMSFGADTNAHTTFGETVYNIDLPESDEATLADGLGVLRDFADGLLLEEHEVSEEKGVIDGEERERDSAQLRVFEQQLRILLDGTRLPERLPIGTKEARDAFDAESLRRFYERWYRPENMTLILVGDLDGLDPVPLFEQAFDSLRAPDEPLLEEPDPGKPLAFGRSFAIYEPEIPTVTLDIERHRLNEDEPYTKENLLEDLPLDFAHGMLNLRFAELAKQEGAPFLGARASRGEVLEITESVSVSVQCAPERWRESLSAGEQELRRALLHGFQEAELAELRAERLRGLDEAVERESTAGSRVLLGRILKAAEERYVPMDAETRRSLLAPAISALTVEACHEALRQAWSEGELSINAAGKLDLGADAGETLLAAYESSRSVDVAASDEIAVADFAYASTPPDPSERERLIERREPVEDLDFLMLRFQNGVAVNLKRTEFKERQILVSVRLGEGRLSLEPESAALATVADIIFNSGGLEAHSEDDLRRLTAGRQAGVSFGIDEDHFSLSGATTAEDLLLQCELTCAYLEHPGWRKEGLTQLQKQIPMLYESLQHQHMGPLLTRFLPEVHSGDQRFGMPPREVLESYGLDDAREWIAPQLKDAPIEVTICGDLELEETIEIAARTFGRLPARRAPRDYPEHRRAPAPRSGVRQTHAIETEVPKSLVAILLPVADGIDPARRHRLNLLNTVVNDRLRVEVRERLGAAYSPRSSVSANTVHPGVGSLMMQAMADPAKVDALIEACLATGDALAKEGVTAGELDRLREPLLRQLRDARRRNGYWMNVLAEAQQRPESLDEARDLDAALRAIEATELSDLANEYLHRERASILVVNPDA